MGQLLYAGGAQKEPSGAGSRDKWEKNSSEGNILTQQRKVSFANALVIEKKIQNTPPHKQKPTTNNKKPQTNQHNTKTQHPGLLLNEGDFKFVF